MHSEEHTTLWNVKRLVSELDFWVRSPRVEIEIPTLDLRIVSLCCGVGQAAQSQFVHTSRQSKLLLSTLYPENPKKGCHNQTDLMAH